MKKELVITYSELGFVRSGTVQVKSFEQAKDHLAKLRSSFPYTSNELALLFAQYKEDNVVKAHWSEGGKQWS